MRIPLLAFPAARTARLFCVFSLLCGAPALADEAEAAADTPAQPAADAPPAGETAQGESAQAESGDAEASPDTAASAPEAANAPATEAPAASEPPPAGDAPIATEPAASGWTKTDGKRIVAYAATGITLVAGAAGVGLGVLAQTKHDCLQDASKCGEGGPLVGADFQRAQGEVAQLAALGDMLYVVAAASAVAAVTGYLSGFLFIDEAEGMVAAPSPELPVTSPVALQSGGAR